MPERSWLGLVDECGAPRRQGQPGDRCRLPAGHGTDHSGVGPCKLHGGSFPMVRRKAAREIAQREAQRAVERLGLSRPIGPVEALLEEVRRAAAMVDWLQEQVELLDQTAPPTSATEALLHLFGVERDRLTRVSKVAVEVGVEVAQVRLAQEYGQMVVNLMRRVFNDPALDLTFDQRELLPGLVRRYVTEATREPA